MPTTRTPFRVSHSSGSFMNNESNFNRHRFTHAWDDAPRSYPSASDVYVRSNRSHPQEDEFADIGLSDLIIAHARVSRRKLERLALDPLLAGFLSRGVLPTMERQEPYNQVLEASLAYAGAAGVHCIDEVALINESVDQLDVKMEELNGRVVQGLDEVRELRERNQELSRELEELRTREQVMAITAGNNRNLICGLEDELRRLTALMESTGGWRNRPLGAAEGAQRLVPFHGRLVPIEEPDRAEEPDHEVIDLTNNSDEVVPDSELDFVGEEEEQAAEARRRGELTFHAEVARAQVDLSPKYRDRPVGNPPLYE